MFNILIFLSVNDMNVFFKFKFIRNLKTYKVK